MLQFFCDEPYELARNLSLSRSVCQFATLLAVSVYPVIDQVTSCLPARSALL